MEPKSVLLIDDSNDMLALEKMILEGAGFNVFTASSGTSGFEVLSKIAHPDLILLDQQLNDMTGFDFMNLLEKRNPEIIANVPIVILTGAEQPEPSQAVGYIQKFPDIDIFLETVHHFMGKH
ncbi:MAG TPA: response regulator [Bdellovibrionales bacterium]|nr:response regulator [Bdellovibrionales bacterium]